LNFGFKYNISGSWNVFSEVTYRFTNSDKIDYFSDVNYHIPRGMNTIYQASTSGSDQYFSTKLGISYSLLNVYGIEQRSNKKLKKQQEAGNSIKNRLFGFLKRK
jgi:hypothetical protein